jgi:hypothetical protein
MKESTHSLAPMAMIDARYGSHNSSTLFPFRWRASCRNMATGTGLYDCYDSGWVNDWDGNLDYQAPWGHVIHGVRSCEWQGMQPQGRNRRKGWCQRRERRCVCVCVCVCVRVCMYGVCGCMCVYE